jgi:CBS domain-containing protein
MVEELATEWFVRSDEHAFPVFEDDRFVGIVAVGDMRKVERDVWGETPVRTVMTPLASLVTTSPSEDARVAMQKLAAREVEQLPVLDRGELVGMLERRGIARWFEIHASANRRHPPEPRHA